MVEYRIRKSTFRCARCEREFELDEAYVSRVDIEEDELSRSDFCDGCFEAPTAEEAPRVAFWRSRRTVAPERKRSIDFPTLRELFFKMAESGAEDHRKVCYLLALVLIRKRFVKLREFVTEDGRDYLVVTTKQRPEPLRLEAPELHPNEFGELKHQLTYLLDVDFDDEGLPDEPDAANQALPAEGAADLPSDTAS